MISVMTVEPWISNLTNNPIRTMFEPYFGLAGAGVFFTFFFGAIGIAIYMQSNHNASLTIGYFLLVQTFVAILLPSPITIIFMIFVAFLAASKAYYSYFVQRE